MSCHNHIVGAMRSVVRHMLAISVALAALCASPAAFALDTGDIVVASIKGEVHVTVAGVERAMKAGSVLETPATVRTGADGAVELKQGTTSVRVGPDSQLEFPAIEARGGSIDRVVQPRGNAFYSIGKRAGHKLRVETPFLVGVVKGTQFNVATQDGATTISLFEGLLEIRAADDSDVTELNAGEIATRKRGDTSITKMKMDGRLPTNAPSPASPGGNGSGGASDDNSPGSATPVVTPRSPRVTTDGESVLAGGVSADTAVLTTLDAGNGTNANVGANLDVRTSAADVNANASVGAPMVSADVGMNLGVGAAGVDAGSNVNVGATGAAVDVGAGVNVAPLGTDLATNTNLNVAPGAVDVSTNTVVDAGPVAAAIGAGVGVTVDNAGVSAGVDTGTTVAVGTTPLVDTTTSAGVGLGTTTSVAVDTSTTVAGVDTGVAAAVNATAGTVDLGLNVAGLNVNLGVNLGLDDGNNGNGNDPTHQDTSNPGNTTPVTAPVVDVTGLLNGLLRRRK
jgi:FecR-like protein